MLSLKPIRIVAFATLCCAAMQFAIVSDLSGQGRDEGSLQSATGSNKPEEPKGKFDEVLDSKDLSGFRGYQSEEIGPGWKIEGKFLVFDGTGSGDIMIKQTYANFELQVEWSIGEGGNSGIMFRVTPGDAEPYMSGPEFQILDDEKHADGKSELTSSGALYGMYPAEGKKLRPVGTWNKSRIVLDGNKLTHYLNGEKVVDVEIGSEDWNKRLAESKFKEWAQYGKATKGHICFQNHGDPVRFRNIRIKQILGEGEVAADKKPKRPSRFSLMEPEADDSGSAQGLQESRDEGKPDGAGSPPAGEPAAGSPQVPPRGRGGPPPGIGDRPGSAKPPGGGGI